MPVTQEIPINECNIEIVWKPQASRPSRMYFTRPQNNNSKID